MNDKPLNVLLILSDQHRHDYTGYAGADWLHTPNLDRLAAQGTVFNKVYSTSPLCAPQRISITAGRYCSNTGCYGNRHSINPDIPTFLHSLQRKGVTTSQIGKLHLVCHGEDEHMHAYNHYYEKLGFDSFHETGGKQGTGMIHTRCHYSDYLASKGVRDKHWQWCGTFSKPGTAKNSDPWPWEEEYGAKHIDDYITTQAETYLKNVDQSKPFYLQVGICGPHPQFDAPTRYRERYKDAKPWYADDLSEEELEDWRAYCACIEQVDEMVGRLMDTLQEQGLADNTIILYTSDHGEMAGERGRWHKGPFYEPSAHVPFIAAGPGVPRGRRIDAMAELIDLGKTVCDFLGTESHHYDQGESMKPTILGEKDTHREDVFCEMGSDKMLYDGRYKLMFGDLTKDTRQNYIDPPYNGPGFGRPVNLPPDVISLYDLQEDPKELNNLAESSEHQSLLNDMIKRLAIRMIRNTQDSPKDGKSVM